MRGVRRHEDAWDVRARAGKRSRALTTRSCRWRPNGRAAGQEVPLRMSAGTDMRERRSRGRAPGIAIPSDLHWYSPLQPMAGMAAGPIHCFAGFGRIRTGRRCIGLAGNGCDTSGRFGRHSPGWRSIASHDPAVARRQV